MNPPMKAEMGISRPKHACPDCIQVAGWVRFNFRARSNFTVQNITDAEIAVHNIHLYGQALPHQDNLVFDKVTIKWPLFGGIPSRDDKDARVFDGNCFKCKLTLDLESWISRLQLSYHTTTKQKPYLLVCGLSCLKRSISSSMRYS